MALVVTHSKDKVVRTYICNECGEVDVKRDTIFHHEMHSGGWYNDELEGWLVVSKPSSVIYDYPSGIVYCPVHANSRSTSDQDVLVSIDGDNISINGCNYGEISLFAAMQIADAVSSGRGVEIRFTSEFLKYLINELFKYNTDL